MCRHGTARDWRQDEAEAKKRGYMRLARMGKVFARTLNLANKKGSTDDDIVSINARQHPAAAIAISADIRLANKPATRSAANYYDNYRIES